METVVMYRDLPGGPAEIKFVDELICRCLCVQCGMLSMCMHEDPEGHIYCNACLRVLTEKRRKYFYCGQGCNNVDVDKMRHVLDAVKETGEKYVDCPNGPQCRVRIPLVDLKAHYIACKPKVICSLCGQDVQSSNWDAHESSCGKESDIRPASKNTSHVQQHELQSPVASAVKPAASAPRIISKSQNVPASTKPLRPSSGALKKYKEPTANLLQSEQVAAVDRDAQVRKKPSETEVPAVDTLRMCSHCGKNVKHINMKRHLVMCAKVPEPCLAPKEDNSKTDIKTTIPAGKSTSKACKAQPAAEIRDQQKEDAALFGRWFQEGNIPPELPTLELSLAEMETWLYCFERSLAMLGITDNATKFEFLSSSLSPEVLDQLRDIAPLMPSLPSHSAYECLLKALFERIKL